MSDATDRFPVRSVAACLCNSSETTTLIVVHRHQKTNMIWALSSRACVQDVVVLELSRLTTPFLFRLSTSLA